MPKIYFSEVDRALARFRRWYYDTKRSRDVNDADIAKKLGKSHQAVSAKMNKKSTAEVSLREAIVIFKEMNASDEEILRLMRM